MIASAGSDAPAARPTDPLWAYFDLQDVRTNKRLLPGGSYRRFVDQFVRLTFRWGATQLFLRCPWGMEPDGSIRLDAWNRSRLNGSDFLDAFSPYARKIALYTGSLHDLKGLSEPEAHRTLDSALLPARVLGASVWFDNSADIAAGTIEERALRYLNATGLATGVEAWPVKGSVSASQNWCIAESFRQTVQAQADAHDPQVRWAEPLATLPGRRISIFAAAPEKYARLRDEPYKWYLAAWADARKLGFDVALSVGEFIRARVGRGRLR